MERRQKIAQVVRQRTNYKDIAKQALGIRIELTDANQQDLLALTLQAEISRVMLLTGQNIPQPISGNHRLIFDNCVAHFNIRPQEFLLATPYSLSYRAMGH